MTHIVQFYENEDALYSLVSEYIAGGLGNGDRVLVVGTEEHRREFTSRLRAKGIDVEAGRLLIEGVRLAHALAEVQGVRSARKVAEHVRVQLDPLDLV